jgi:phosphoglycolate phosphatase-like HAD superfamily hydrolase
MRIAVVVEIEGLLFDTAALRGTALRDALRVEGIECSVGEVLRAHDGAPAWLALSALQAGAALDDTARSLVLRRATDHVSSAIARELPSFDPVTRDLLVQLAADHPIGVVTRGTVSDARLLLESIGLDGYIGTVHTLDEFVAASPSAVWTRAVTRLHAEQAIAIAPRAMLTGATTAGLPTVEVTGAGLIAAGDGSLPLATLNGDTITALVALNC